MPDTQQRRPSARSQVAQRDGGDAEFAKLVRARIDTRMRDATSWFAKVAPAHVDAERYVALAIGHIHRQPSSKPGEPSKLVQACLASPESLMIALVDCARLGLTVGDTYHLVPFWDKHTSAFVVTGMRDYKGEVELIYRSGMVDAVYSYAVRGGEGAKTPDVFRWRPGMTFPEHVIADDGLADPADRGPLRGAYAYARMVSGGYSPVVVMSKAQVLRTRPANAPAEFWGPDWPAEGPNTEAMWAKGPVHRLYARVPHSADYVAEVQRGQALALEASRALGLPQPGVAAVEAPESALMLTGTVVPPGERRSSARERVDRPKPVAQLRRDVAALFASAGFGEPNDARQRGVASMLIRENPDDGPVEVRSLADLSQAQLTVLTGKLTQLRDEAATGGRDIASDLTRLARAAGLAATNGADA